MTTLADITGLTDSCDRNQVSDRLGPLLPAAPLANLSREKVASLAAERLATELKDPLENVVIAGCQQDIRLRAKAHPDKADERTPTTVTLGQCTISRVERPSLELEIGHSYQSLLELTLTVELTFTTLAVDVVDGRALRMHPAKAEASASLSAAGIEIARRDKVPLFFPEDSDEPEA